MSTLSQDIRYAIRMLARSPGFTVVALLVIALGIGANTTLFSVVNAVLLKPLPYPEADQLVQIQRDFLQGRSDAMSLTQFLFWQENNTTFESMMTHDGQGGGINLVEGDRPERIPSIRISPDFFHVLGAEPQLGRDFQPLDSALGAERVCVISDGLWRRRFGGEPSIIGRSLSLSGENFLVVGVMGRGFDFKTHADIWTPLTLEGDNVDGSAVYYIVGRLQDDVTLAQAQVDMDIALEKFRGVYPDQIGPNASLFLRSHLDQVVGDVRPVLLILLGAVGLVLLIACANVANLLLARATGRQREIALRATLGASRVRIVRQLLTESTLLAAGGGVLGLLLAQMGMKLLVVLKPESLPRLDAIELDGMVLGFTMGVATLTGVLFGLIPALQATRVDLHEALKEGTSGAGSGLSKGRARSALVVSEVALALVLLIGAGLLIDSFMRVMTLHPGYDAERVLTMKMSFAGVSDMTTARFTNLTGRMIERIEATPGVEAVATISTLPLEHGLMNLFDIEGKIDPDAVRPAVATQWRMISTDYFKAMGITLLKGRVFTDQDTAESENVIIINDTLARRFFPDEEALGQRLVSGPPDDESSYSRIVGVVSDIQEMAIDRPPFPTSFTPVAQTPDGATAFIANVLPTCWIVRTAGDPMSYSTVVQREMLAIDAGQPVSDVRTMQDVVSESIAGRQFTTLLLGIFAALALLLAAIGIYGVMSYAVAQRTREIGIRMALGAARRDTMRLILGDGMKLATIGAVVGLAGAFGLTRLMANMLFEISARDPWMFTLVTFILLGVAALACLLPTLRATRVDPMVALRSD